MNHEREVNAIEALVSRVRRKLGAGVIESKRGFGYRSEADTRDNLVAQTAAFASCCTIDQLCARHCRLGIQHALQKAC